MSVWTKCAVSNVASMAPKNPLGLSSRKIPKPSGLVARRGQKLFTVGAELCTVHNGPVRERQLEPTRGSIARQCGFQVRGCERHRQRTHRRQPSDRQSQGAVAVTPLKGILRFAGEYGGLPTRCLPNLPENGHCEQKQHRDSAERPSGALLKSSRLIDLLSFCIRPHNFCVATGCKIGRSVFSEPLAKIVAGGNTIGGCQAFGTMI